MYQLYVVVALQVFNMGISFPAVSLREIFAEIVSMSWSKVAVSLSALVGIFIEPFAGDVPNCMWW